MSECNAGLDNVGGPGPKGAVGPLQICSFCDIGWYSHVTREEWENVNSLLHLYYVF